MKQFGGGDTVVRVTGSNFTGTIGTVLAMVPTHAVRSSREYNRSEKGKAKQRAYYRARGRAYVRLAHAHEATYKRFLTEELSSEPEYRQ